MLTRTGSSTSTSMAGTRCCSAGHCHPRVVVAIREQAGRLRSFSEPLLQRARRRAWPRGSRGFGPGRASSSATAAPRRTRRRSSSREAPTRRDRHARGGFHGVRSAPSRRPPADKRTRSRRSCTASSRCPTGTSRRSRRRSSSDIAAVMLEAIQPGRHLADSERYCWRRAACDRHGALLIFDEVQSGWAARERCGRSSEHAGRPDLLTAAKALAGGLPSAPCRVRRGGRRATSPASRARLRRRPAGRRGGDGDPDGSTTTSCRRACVCSATGCESGSRGMREQGPLTDVRGRGLMVGADLPEPNAAGTWCRARGSTPGSC